MSLAIVITNSGRHILLVEVLLPTDAQGLLVVCLVHDMHALRLVGQTLDTCLVASSLVQILREHSNALLLIWLSL